MTFRELIIRVAEAVGVASYPDAADNSASIPEDPNTLRFIKQAINDARVEFYGENSKLVATSSSLPGTWKFLSLPYELQLYPDGLGPQNIESDPSRYRLPPSRQGPVGRGVTITAATSVGIYPPIEVTSMERVRMMAAASGSGTGSPVMLAIDPQPIGANGQARWELMVWPPPDQSYTLEIPLRLSDGPLVDLNEHEPSPYPLAIEAYAVYRIARDGKLPEAPDVTSAEQRRLEWLQRARTQELAMTTPRTLGTQVAPDVATRSSAPFVGLENLFGVPVDGVPMID